MTYPNDPLDQHPGPVIPYYPVAPVTGYRTRPPRAAGRDFHAVMQSLKTMTPAEEDAADRAEAEAGRELGRWLRRFTSSVFTDAVAKALRGED